MPRVLFIPGLPGSELRRRRPDGSHRKLFPPGIDDLLPSLDSELRGRLQAPDDLATDDGVFAPRPIKVALQFLGFDLMKQYDSLYDNLKGLGIPASERLDFGWDWRRPVTDDAFPTSAQPALVALLAAQPRPVTVIAHSTGGLVLRHCLEQAPELAARVERVIAFGVPWAGTLKGLAALTRRQHFGPIGPRDAQEIFASSWSALDLLPRNAGTRLVTDASGQEVDLLAATDWTSVPSNHLQGDLGVRVRRRAAHSLATLGRPQAEWTLPIDVVNVVGWGKKTIVRATLRSDGGLDLEPADLDNESGDAAEDASAVEGTEVYEGDGTVPVASAAFLVGPRVKTYFVPIGAVAQVTHSNRRHSELWRNPAAKRLLAHHLAGRPLAAQAHAAVDWRDRVNPGAADVRIRYVMQGPDGAPLPGAEPRVMVSGGSVAGSVAPDGRGSLRIERARFPKTAPPGRFRRVVARLAWDEDPRPMEQAMFIEP